MGEAVDPSLDADWSLEVLVVLIPHPKLSPAQKRVVMNDYGMDKSGCYALTCRKAMLFYTLRHLNPRSSEVLDDPAKQHVIIKNRTEVDAWVSDGAWEPGVG